MTRRQFNQLINELDGKSPFIVLHKDVVAPKYVGVESINDDYKPKKVLISKLLSIADSINSNKGLKKD